MLPTPLLLPTEYTGTVTSEGPRQNPRTFQNDGLWTCDTLEPGAVVCLEIPTLSPEILGEFGGKFGGKFAIARMLPGGGIFSDFGNSQKTPWKENIFRWESHKF